MSEKSYCTLVTMFYAGRAKEYVKAYTSPGIENEAAELVPNTSW